MNNLQDFFENKDILVTGGAGYIGSHLVQRLLEYNVKRVRVFDNNEYRQFRLQEKLKNHEKLRILIGDVRDRNRLKMAMKNVDIVFHAAALKHVPICEYNPFEAIATNVYGTQNVVDAARDEQVDRFVFISTDKAVNPINTMGATKLLGEKIVLNASFADVKTLFSCVRFGNVINSSGSVIPIFRKQIKNGGPVTLTSKDIVRFFISIKDATELTLRAAEKMKGREIFILKMSAAKISDMAEIMIEELASKYGHKQADIKIETIGLRAGEKISELLMTEEEAKYGENNNGMFILRPGIFTPHYILKEKGMHAAISPDEYDANMTKLLTRNEIKDILYKNKII